MELRLLAITSCALLIFSASINAGTREVFSIPSKNSIDLKGQDALTINPNKKLPRLNFVKCATRTYAGFIVTDAAEIACRAVKRSIVLRPLKKYPKPYRPTGLEGSFEIPGNPYYIFPIDYKGKTYGANDADFVVINERCQLVGALILTNGKTPKKVSRRKRKRALRQSRTFVKKCILNIFDQKV